MQTKNKQSHTPIVAAFGVVCLDYIVIAPYIDPGGYSPIKDYKTEGGGLQGNALVAASRLGAETYILGWVGSDDIGDEIISGLEKENINTQGLVRVQDGKSVFSWVLVDSETAERTIYCRKDYLPNKSIDDIDFSLIDKADVLMFDDHFSNEARKVAEYAKNKGIFTVCDIRLREENYDILALSDYAIISDKNVLSLSADNDYFSALSKMLELGCSNAVITAGENGCYYSDGNKKGHIKAFEIDAIDTTGAGDAFHGAFAFCIAKKMNLNESLVYSSAVSAINCLSLGGRSGLPNPEEVASFLKIH